MTPTTFACIDVESTGLDFSNEPIQIAIKKWHNYVRNECNFNTYIKPKNQIPPEITELSGITNEMVADAPSFEEIADKIIDFCKDCVLVTFNGNQFDIPFLNQKFSDIGKTFPDPDTKTADVARLFAKVFPRDLASVLKVLTGKSIEEIGSAHDAQTDVEATLDSFHALISKYGDIIGTTVDEWDAKSKKEGQVDWAGKLYTNKDGVICYAIGKSKGIPVKDDTGFGYWIMNQSWCTNDTRHKIQSEFAKAFPFPKDNSDLPF